MAGNPYLSQVSDWRSILTLIIFFGTTYIPIYIPRPLWQKSLDRLARARILNPRQKSSSDHHTQSYKKFRFPLNFVTTPLIADLILLAIGAIGKREIRRGIFGADNIVAIDIALFSLSLAYFAVSIDCSGILRYAALKTLMHAGRNGRLLYLYFYLGVFLVSALFGNDVVTDMGTAFTSYAFRVTDSTKHLRAWIHTLFVAASVAATILVSSSPTNVVISGAFNIGFFAYTANVVVPVIATAACLLPFLMYFVFFRRTAVPDTLTLRRMPTGVDYSYPINPNLIPHESSSSTAASESDQLRALHECLNPYVDKFAVVFTSMTVLAAFVTIVLINALLGSQYPVFWITAPAAVLLLCFDLAIGWQHRCETRRIVHQWSESQRWRAQARSTHKILPYGQNGQNDRSSYSHSPVRSQPDQKLPKVHARASPADHTALPKDRRHSFCCIRSQQSDEFPSPGDALREVNAPQRSRTWPNPDLIGSWHYHLGKGMGTECLCCQVEVSDTRIIRQMNSGDSHGGTATSNCVQIAPNKSPMVTGGMIPPSSDDTGRTSKFDIVEPRSSSDTMSAYEQEYLQSSHKDAKTLQVLLHDASRWTRTTFPTVRAAFPYLPYRLFPFPLTLFIMIQALVETGWVRVFAWAWDRWVIRTGPVGAIVGMGFGGVLFSNFAGTNIGASVVFSRMLQEWVEIHTGNPITQRELWGAVYALAISVNFGAFSFFFNASLNGLQWKEALEMRHIPVRSKDFAKTNLPIVFVALAVALPVLVGVIYVTRDTSPYILT